MVPEVMVPFKRRKKVLLTELLHDKILRGVQDPTGMRKEVESQESALTLQAIWDFEVCQTNFVHSNIIEIHNSNFMFFRFFSVMLCYTVKNIYRDT